MTPQKISVIVEKVQTTTGETAMTTHYATYRNAQYQPAVFAHALVQDGKVVTDEYGVITLLKTASADSKVKGRGTLKILQSCGWYYTGLVEGVAD